ncbi:hypothetical protein ACFSSE_15955 [Pedobacter alpinus]|uniref:Uncharacterized protein n=1 Tax=Pedobacter alpinus TaxID=1590643 RepID=A0ABW5TVR0_9SPHI
MKKILVVIMLVSALGASSCKKESEVQPKETKVLKLSDSEDETNLDKSNVSTWD